MCGIKQTVYNKGKRVQNQSHSRTVSCESGKATGLQLLMKGGLVKRKRRLMFLRGIVVKCSTVLLSSLRNLKLSKSKLTQTLDHLVEINFHRGAAVFVAVGYKRSLEIGYTVSLLSLFCL